MNDLLFELLAVTVGASVVPLYPVVVLLLLQNPGGLGKAVAFISGAVGVRLAQGLLFGVVLQAAVADAGAEGGGMITATLLLVLGILLLVSAYRKWRKEVDPDEPPPKWMTGLGSLSAPKAAAMGALYVAIAAKQWVFTLSALGIIAEADLGPPAGIAAYLLFVLATQALVLPLVLAAALAPQRAAQPLRAAQGWLERHNRVIVVMVSLVFGMWFLYKGVTGLLG